MRLTLPYSAPNAVREVRHLVEYKVNLGDHVLTIHENGCPSRGTQGDVEDGSVLSNVDLLPPEHGVNPNSQAGFLCQLQKELESLIGDAILGVVQIDAHSLGSHMLATLGIVLEQLSEM